MTQDERRYRQLNSRLDIIEASITNHYRKIDVLRSEYAQLQKEMRQVKERTGS